MRHFEQVLGDELGRRLDDLDRSEPTGSERDVQRRQAADIGTAAQDDDPPAGQIVEPLQRWGPHMGHQQLGDILDIGSAEPHQGLALRRDGEAAGGDIADPVGEQRHELAEPGRHIDRLDQRVAPPPLLVQMLLEGAHQLELEAHRLAVPDEEPGAVIGDQDGEEASGFAFARTRHQQCPLVVVDHPGERVFFRRLGEQQKPRHADAADDDQQHRRQVEQVLAAQAHILPAVARRSPCVQGCATPALAAMTGERTYPDRSGSRSGLSAAGVECLKRRAIQEPGL